MKDAVTGDTPRRGGNNLRPEDFRMGKPAPLGASRFGGRATQGTEPSKYLEEKKSIEIPKVAASEMGTA